MDGGAEPVDVPPAPEPSPGEPAQPAAAASTPPVSAAAASLAVRASLIRIPSVCPPGPARYSRFWMASWRGCLKVTWDPA